MHSQGNHAGPACRAARRVATALRTGVASVACAMALSTAQATPSSRQYVFDIPEQPLAEALRAYARVTGESVFFDGDLAKGRHSAEVSGEFAAGAALGRLLSGTRLRAVYTPAGTLMLHDAGPPIEAPAPEPAPQAEKNDVPVPEARGVQAALEHSLCRSAAARPGSYRALLQVNINESGRVQHVDMVTSSGSPVRDRAIQAALLGMPIVPPEAAAPGRPYVILLRPQNVDVCGASVAGVP